MAQETLPVVTGDKDRSLQDVLTRLTSSRAPMGPDADPIVTASHRLPAMAASFAPYPEGTDDRLISALRARGIEQLYTHQAEAFGHVLGGHNVVTITPTASGKTLCYNAPVLNAILQDSATRALYLFPSFTRSPRSRHVGRISRLGCSPTTATRRRMRAGPSGARRTWCSATPTCCIPESCRTIHGGRNCSRTCGSW